MRRILKGAPPRVLVENLAEWHAHLTANPSEHNKIRYRHPEIKAALLTETSSKCVYCESKIGHNCPGDIEHKIPKAKRMDLIFDWNNMTIACTECNRRKAEYYDTTCMFLDPNVDDVEQLTIHVGPLVFNCPGAARSEVTLRILELSDFHRRRELAARKLEKLEQIRNLCERIATEERKVLREFLLEDLREHCEAPSEFSGMIRAYVDNLPVGWANNGFHADAH